MNAITIIDLSSCDEIDIDGAAAAFLVWRHPGNVRIKAWNTATGGESVTADQLDKDLCVDGDRGLKLERVSLEEARAFCDLDGNNVVFILDEAAQVYGASLFFS